MSGWATLWVSVALRNVLVLFGKRDYKTWREIGVWLGGMLLGGVQGGKGGPQTEALGGRVGPEFTIMFSRESSFPDASKKPREAFKTLNCAEAGDSRGGGMGQF